MYYSMPPVPIQCPVFISLPQSGVSTYKKQYYTGTLAIMHQAPVDLAGTGLGSKVIFGYGKAAGLDSTDHCKYGLLMARRQCTFMLKDFGANSFKTNVLPQFTYLNGKVLFEWLQCCNRN